MAVEVTKKEVMSMDIILTMAIDLAVVAAELVGKSKEDVIKMIDNIDVERHPLIEKFRQRISQE